MAWPDGSRFLIAKGVKWGTGPAFYKGASYDTPWNHDLNWKDYVVSDSKKRARERNRVMVQTPAQEGAIHTVVHPEATMVWREATKEETGVDPNEGYWLERVKRVNSDKLRMNASGEQTGQPDKRALSSAGRRMLASATGDGGPRGGTPKARTPASRVATSRGGSVASSRVMSPTAAKAVLSETRATRKELSMLKDTLKRQQAAQERTEQQMSAILDTLQKVVPTGKKGARK